MAFDEVTRRGVTLSLAEFDGLGRKAFLEKYGYGKARRYFLLHEGRCYDSKAIVGVAHQYDQPDLGPLRSEEFSGGKATVVRHLESLGFQIETVPANPARVEEETDPCSPPLP